jgi:hypothetical protein
MKGDGYSIADRGCVARNIRRDLIHLKIGRARPALKTRACRPVQRKPVEKFDESPVFAPLTTT